MKQTNTYNKILDAAEALIAKQGYSAFSYKDIANEVGIKTSSIHYYFPSKVDLGKVIMQRHREGTVIFLADLESKGLAVDKMLIMLIDTIMKGTYKNENRMCLAAMMAIDVLILDEQIIYEVKQFFALFESWIEKILFQAGIEHAKREAKVMMACIEGTLLLSRLFLEQERISYLKKQVQNLFN